MPVSATELEQDLLAPLTVSKGVILFDDPQEPSFEKEVLIPLRKVQAKRAKADREALERKKRKRRVQVTHAVVRTPQSAPAAPTFAVAGGGGAVSGGLTGREGWVSSQYGNCVNEPGVNNPGYGNPSSWPATGYSPWIGATALFHYDHVGVVVGIWSNGDVEVRHQNWKGTQHRFPASTFRGYR